MMKHLQILALSAVLGLCTLMQTPAFAQEAVVGVENPEALFTSPDPQLNANKQVVLHIVRDLLEAGHWDQADQYLSEGYIQHNPLIPSGRATVVDYFTKVLKLQPKPIPEKMQTKIVAVLAEGDLVTVVYPRNVEATGDVPAYSTTWFDMWRIKDGKAVEHWDPAVK